MPAEPLRRAFVGGLVLLGVATLFGCTPAPAPQPSLTTAAARPFTVMVAGRVGTLDPAAALSRTDSILVANVFQRLMQVSQAGELKPDAASDCAFVSRLAYECALPPTLAFQNGRPVTSADVRFSIQRALRLNVAGTSVGLLSSLVRVEAPDPQTVRFVLSRPDNQFGYALAGQATSIVDRTTFDPDAVLPAGVSAVGSGPYAVSATTDDSVTLTRYAGYVGPNGAALPEVRLQVAPDSAAAEAAIAAGNADVVWACLDDAAQSRLANEMAANAGATARGFTRLPTAGVRVTRLYWNSASKLRGNTELRNGVAKALQADRTLDSLVPLGVADRVSAFPVGGRVHLPKLTGPRIHLSLGYDPSEPGAGDAARLLRDRIEELGGVSVQLTTTEPSDLVLTTRPAWVNNALGWLQLYLGSPLPSSAAKLSELESQTREEVGPARSANLSELQLQAATDNTVLPVSQGDLPLLVGPGARMAPGNFGSGNQLGLWGFSRG